VTARHRKEREMLKRAMDCTVEKMKLKTKKKKRKRFAVECEVIEKD
jgi:hypothetical protein